jgi:hypothetical protein
MLHPLSTIGFEVDFTGTWRECEKEEIIRLNTDRKMRSVVYGASLFCKEIVAIYFTPCFSANDQRR